jgi:hypothetical protein
MAVPVLRAFVNQYPGKDNRHIASFFQAFFWGIAVVFFCFRWNNDTKGL